MPYYSKYYELPSVINPLSNENILPAIISGIISGIIVALIGAILTPYLFDDTTKQRPRLSRVGIAVGLVLGIVVGIIVAFLIFWSGRDVSPPTPTPIPATATSIAPTSLLASPTSLRIDTPTLSTAVPISTLIPTPNTPGGLNEEEVKVLLIPDKDERLLAKARVDGDHWVIDTKNGKPCCGIPIRFRHPGHDGIFDYNGKVLPESLPCRHEQPNDVSTPGNRRIRCSQPTLMPEDFKWDGVSWYP